MTGPMIKPSCAILLVVVSILALTGCGSPEPSEDGFTAGDLALSVNIPFSEISLPPHNRPDGRAPAEELPLEGWERMSDGNFTAPFPVLIHHRFFKHPPMAMQIVDSTGNVIPHFTSAIHGDVYWTFDNRHLMLHGLNQRPDRGKFRLIYSQARDREARLNWEYSGIKDPSEFARITIQSGAECRSGLLVPAPGVLGWNIRLPGNARLEFSPGLLAPEIMDGPQSDGAVLSVEIETGQRSKEIWKKKVTAGVIHDVEIDLGKWSGREVTLRFITQPGPSNTFDYVFVGDPVIVTPRANPRRVVLIFIDTLRPDHLGFFGYHRNTSPSFDAWARDGLVFTAARSVAPWTLPSLRSAVTGRYPEYYGVSNTVQGRIRNQGWATAMMSGNVYCGPQFDMHRDWGYSRVDLSPLASQQVDRAANWLGTHGDRNCFLVVHFMDTHLPYQEPDAYRRLFAGDTPPDLPGDIFHRDEVTRAQLHNPQDQQYVRDRYDNSVRYLDSQLSRLFKLLGDTDMVVLFSDHGEEFWDHGRFEHGHALYDELLRVPFIIRAPGLAPGMDHTPVSLVDLAPTVLAYLGLDADGLDGKCLLPTTLGKEGPTPSGDRRFAFGYPLYGVECWGILEGPSKYVTRRGTEQLYDLDTDPGETQDLFRSSVATDPGTHYRSRLAETLNRPVGIGYRLWVNHMERPPIEDTVATIRVPGGINAAWVGDDPLATSQALVSIKGETLVVRWLSGSRKSRSIWIMPVKPIEDVTPVLTGALSFGGMERSFSVEKDVDTIFPQTRDHFLMTRAGQRVMYLGLGIAPIPGSLASPLEGYDADVDGMLKALGYVSDTDMPNGPH